MKHKPIHFLYLFIALVLCGTAVSCSTQRSAGTAQTTPSTETRAPQIAELAGSCNEWESFYAPFSFRLSKPANFSFSGRATMVYGKAINLSMRILGMEVGVVYIDNDSAIVLDKYHKYYLSLPLSSVTARTSVTLSDIQSIMLGQPVYPGKGPLSRIKNPGELFSQSQSGNRLILTPRKSPKGATWYLTLAPGPQLSSITVEPDGLAPFVATFSDIVSSVAGSVASDINVTGSVGKKELDAEIEWNMNRAEWNGSRTVDKPSYKGYKKLDINEMLKALKNK